jgi:copper(I)-binding protein
MNMHFFQVVGATALMSLSPFLLAQADTKSLEYRLGQIKIENPYVRATVAGQKAAGGFMKIENKGVADQLIAASSPLAGEMQLHTMTMDGNVMKMRELKTIDIPANGSVDLKPGGLHLMFMEIQSPFKAGDVIPVKLRFQKAGELEIRVPVRKMGPTSGHKAH